MYARDILAEISRIAVSVAIDCTIYNESSLPRAHAQGVKQSVFMSVVVVVVVVVGKKIARSRVLGIYAC